MSNQPTPGKTSDGLPDLSPAADHFEMLGLPRQFDLSEDEIRAAYRGLARATHPDRFAGASDEVVAKANELSAAVNAAYRALLDPVSRASYMLTLAGGPGPEDVRDVPGNLLMQVMTLREQIEADKQEGNEESLKRHRQSVEGERAAAIARMKTLASSIDTADTNDKTNLRMELNAIRYYDNLLVELARDPLTNPTD